MHAWVQMCFSFKNVQNGFAFAGQSLDKDLQPRGISADSRARA